jgi:glycosyltransferase involved in cell wall biosynthesis
MAGIKNLSTPYQDYFSRNINLERPDYSWQSLKKIKNIIYNKDAQHDVAQLIMDTRPDLVHCHNIYHHLSPSILPVFKYFKLPVVMTVHDFNLICPNYLLFTGGKICERCKRRRYYNCFLHRCVKDSFGASAVAALESYIHRSLKIYEKNVDLFIAPSHFLKNKLVEWGWPVQRITVIPHFLPAAKTASRQKGDYVLYAGALKPDKGVEQLIKVWQTEKLNIDLHIAGDGPQRPYLEKLVEKYNLHYRVIFLGHLPEAKLVAEIRGCKFAVVPSLYYEVFGLAALEALAQGKPVLVSAFGALPEIVNPEVGMIFSPEQPHSLARSLHLMLEGLNLDEMGQRGYQLVKEKYNADGHYQRIMEVYNKLLNC